MINFYHRIIAHAATILRPLYCALKDKSPKQPLTWSDDMNSVHAEGISALVDITLLAHPYLDAPLSVSSDTSDIGVGACLEQCVNGHWLPHAFFRKQLRDPERKYSTYNRELLALYFAVRSFRFFIEGRNLTLFTDHNPLVDAMCKTSDPWTARQQRQLTFISEFTTDINHIAGKNTLMRCYEYHNTDV